MPRIVIGVIAGAGDYSAKAAEAARQLGREIAGRGAVVLTGACPGLPQEAVQGAKEAGGQTLGISPAPGLVDHRARYQFPTEGLDVIIYTGLGLSGRGILNVHSSDAVVVVGGRLGTLEEFTIAYACGKLIGVLEGTGGVADSARALARISPPNPSAKIIYEKDPAVLVDQLLKAHEELTV